MIRCLKAFFFTFFKHVVQDVAAGLAKRFDIGVFPADGFDAGDFDQIFYDVVAIGIDVGINAVKIFFVHKIPLVYKICLKLL